MYPLYDSIMRPTAGALLGLGDNWEYGIRTQDENNGFDMLFAHGYKLNTNGEGAGLNRAFKNSAIMMKGYYIGGGPAYWLNDQTLGTIHETLHTYSCEHVDYIRYIMSGYLGDYIMHSQTISEIDLTTFIGFG